MDHIKLFKNFIRLMQKMKNNAIFFIENISAS